MKGKTGVKKMLVGGGTGASRSPLQRIQDTRAAVRAKLDAKRAPTAGMLANRAAADARQAARFGMKVGGKTVGKKKY